MRVAVLGPLEVLTDASVPVAVPGATERLLLAVLAAGAPGVVDRDRLLGSLSGDEGLESSEESLRAHLGCLRGFLEPALPEHSSGQFVLRRGRGYVLAVGRCNVDALRFTDLVHRGRARLAAGDPAEAIRFLSTAVALWRGEPFADWPAADFAEAERSRLHELRTDAEEALAEARRSLRDHADAVAVQPRAVRLPVPRTPPDDVRLAPEQAPHREQETPVAPPDTGAEPLDTLDRPGLRGGREPGRGRGRTPMLAGILVAALVVAGLAIRSQQEAGHAVVSADRVARASVVADANRLAALASTADALDTSLLLSVEAVRLADTPETRAGLYAAVAGLGRVQRVRSFRGVPQDPVLSGGGRTLSFGIGTAVVTWPVGPDVVPHVLMDIPGAWGHWRTTAASPTEDELLGAGVANGVPWLRMISTSADSRLLLEGDQLGGSPLDAAISADGRRILLLVAAPDEAAPKGSSRWRLLDVAVADGTKRNTGVAGRFPAPVGSLLADFADDAGSFVLWDAGGSAPAVRADLVDGRITPIQLQRRPAPTTAFRALPSGTAQLWGDGAVTLADRAGATAQFLDVQKSPVRDVAVSPDGTWAVTAGDGPGLFRWDVDASTGRWSSPKRMTGHRDDVAGVVVDATGRTLFTVALDGTVISWDMTSRSVPSDRVDRRAPDTAAWLHEACTVVTRDLTPVEWRKYLPDRRWEPTCTDLI